MPNRYPPPPGLRPAAANARQNFPASRVNNPARPCGNPPPPRPAPAPTTLVAPQITTRCDVVLVKKPYARKLSRRMMILRVDQAFDGTGTFTVTKGSDRVKIFRFHNGGVEIRSGDKFPGARLSAGIPIFVEAVKASSNLNDVTLQLALTPGPTTRVKPPAKAKLTCVEVTLDICKSRKKRGSDPEPFSTGDKQNPGRFLQVQDAVINSGRAMLIVRKAVPKSFAGNLVLAPKDARVRIFAAADDPPARGQTALANISKPNGEIPSKGLKFWAEGVSVSAVLRDTGFLLGVDGVGAEGDFVNVTVVQFSDMTATIKPTPQNSPANAVSAGLAAPGTHTFQCASISRNFTVNTPLVLMRNAQPDIELKVTCVPPRLPILWQAIRNEADSGSLGKAGDVPTVTPDAHDVKKATLNASAKGSFRVRAYIDCNDTGKYEDLIDCEPSIPLNLVLADARLVKDNSAANSGGRSGNLSTNIGNHYITVVNGLWPTGGGALTAAHLRQAGMGMKIIADVTGGGADGRLGLDKVFSGLVNMVQNRDVIGTYTDNTVAPPTTQHWKFIAASNAAAATGGAAGSNFFQPGDPAPALYQLPLLDSGRPSAGTGGLTATMSRSAAHASVDRSVGQRWTIQCVDSPKISFPVKHPANTDAQLSQIHYHYEFIACFCFWTNITVDRGATGDPADRLYSVLRIDHWEILGDWNVVMAGVPPARTLRVVNRHKITVPSRRTISPLGRAQDNTVEVRGPSGILIAVWDGSS
ncbi:MAG TPA: hypothetical protein VJN93_07875 [Candidatus Acidoferrum sp.]|nr:hypothetical protein [Candidatus Acidoferrum sp.]